MNWLLDNLDLIALIISIIANVLALLLGKTKKTKRATAIMSIWSNLTNWVNTAEKIAGLDGTARKVYVMDQAELTFSALGLTLTEEERAQISSMVDNMVRLSKEINTSFVKVEQAAENTTPATEEQKDVIL